MSTQHIKTGDTVKHRPTGETWLVAIVDGSALFPCGWPETRADFADCELLESCTPEASVNLLRELADKGRHDDSRGSRAYRELVRLRVPEYVEKERRFLDSAIAGAQRKTIMWRAQLAELERTEVPQ